MGFSSKNINGPIYLCINGDESEPGTFNNRVLMEEDPHQVLEGIVIAGYAVQATTAYFYLRFEYGKSYRRLQKAIDEMYEKNLLGRTSRGRVTASISIFIAALVRTFAVRKQDSSRVWKGSELGLGSSHHSPRSKVPSVVRRLSTTSRPWPVCRIFCRVASNGSLHRSPQGSK